MLRSEAVARVKQGLGFRTDLDDAIVSALQEAQREFESGMTLGNFLIEKDATLLTVPLSQSITKPTGFIRFVEYEGPHYTTTEEGLFYLAIRPYDEAKRYYSTRDAGKPRALAIRSGEFAVFPVPDIEYTITTSYFKKAEILDSDIENAWLANYPDLLLNRAGMLIAADLEHAAAYAKFEKKYSDWLERYLSDNVREEEQNMPRQMGVNQ